MSSMAGSEARSVCRCPHSPVGLNSKVCQAHARHRTATGFPHQHRHARDGDRLAKPAACLGLALGSAAGLAGTTRTGQQCFPNR